MRLTRKDGLATLFVAAAAVLYALWLTGAALPEISTRVLGGVVLALGWAACTTNQAEMAAVYGVGGRLGASIVYAAIASLIGAVALTAGVITLVSASEGMLATLVGATVTLWAISTVRHAFSGGTQRDDAAILRPLDKAA